MGTLSTAIAEVKTNVALVAKLLTDLSSDMEKGDRQGVDHNMECLRGPGVRLMKSVDGLEKKFTEKNKKFKYRTTHKMVADKAELLIKNANGLVVTMNLIETQALNYMKPKGR